MDGLPCLFPRKSSQYPSSSSPTRVNPSLPWEVGPPQLQNQDNQTKQKKPQTKPKKPPHTTLSRTPKKQPTKKKNHIPLPPSFFRKIFVYCLIVLINCSVILNSHFPPLAEL